MVFDASAFVSDVQSAAASADPVAAVHEVVASAIRDGSSIDATLGTEFKREPDTLFSSETLTVQRILWPGGVWTSPHDHRVWAVIGVYTGEEMNRLYKNTSDGLQELQTCAVAQRDVLVLDADAIHRVDNQHRELTAGLHVYGGDMVGGAERRNSWGPDGLKVPSSQNALRLMSMYLSMYDLAKECGLSLDDDALYNARRALRTASYRERRYPTSVEVRGILSDAWSLAS
jgi:predicted metal-dependent enzyme (double-stranded beta helix superfamily)